MNIVRRTCRLLLDIYRFLLVSRLASRKLSKMACDSDNDVEKMVNLAFSFEYKQKFPISRIVNVKPLQVRSEIATLCRIIQNANPKIIVEIGTSSGGTLFLFARIANPKMMISIDLPGGSFGGGYPLWKIPFFKSFSKEHAIELIRADSHDWKTLERVRTILRGNEVDVLFIDGDHTYQGAKKDFQMYSAFVRKGGIVVFHDIVASSWSCCHVDDFWNKIKQSYHHLEIIEDQAQKWAGIGVLYFQ